MKARLESDRRARLITEASARPATWPESTTLSLCNVQRSVVMLDLR